MMHSATWTSWKQSRAWRLQSGTRCCAPWSATCSSSTSPKPWTPWWPTTRTGPTPGCTPVVSAPPFWPPCPTGSGLHLLCVWPDSIRVHPAPGTDHRMTWEKWNLVSLILKYVWQEKTNKPIKTLIYF